VIILALLWYSQRQRRMRRNRPLIAVTTVPQNQNWPGGGPAPYQGFQSPGPSYNPPMGGNNEFPSYPPNYAPPAYGKDAPGGFQPYPSVSIYLSYRFVQAGLMSHNSLLVLPL